MAFHVDYWNYLGWRDRFSDSAYSRRQKQYQREGGLPGVYTPAFVVNGNSWRPRSMLNHEPHLVLPMVGNLKLDISSSEIDATFITGLEKAGSLRLNIALLGMGMTTEIKAGENRGRLSEHEFVVLSHKQYRATSRDGQLYGWRVGTPAFDPDAAPAFAIVAWVSSKGSIAPVQAVGGPVPENFFH